MSLATPQMCMYIAHTTAPASTVCECFFTLFLATHSFFANIFEQGVLNDVLYDKVGPTYFKEQFSRLTCSCLLSDRATGADWATGDQYVCVYTCQLYTTLKSQNVC